MSGFVATPEVVASIFAKPAKDDQEGITFSYTADEEKIRSVLPPCLEYVSPVVYGYIAQVKDPSFTSVYNESALWVEAKHGDEVLPYPLSLMVQGPGAECALIEQDRICGIPVKYADKINLFRRGDMVFGSVERHNVIILAVSARLDEAAEPAGEVVRPERMWGRKYRMSHGEDDGAPECGQSQCSDVRLLALNASTEIGPRIAANLENVQVASTPDDAYGELACVELGTASWDKVLKHTIEGAEVVEEIDGTENMPYFVTGRFDRSMMFPQNARDFSI